MKNSKREIWKTLFFQEVLRFFFWYHVSTQRLVRKFYFNLNQQNLT